VIDGGYFENFGALSALELAHAATRVLNDEQHHRVKLVILMISSDPDLNKNHMLVRIKKSTSPMHPGKCLVSVAERELRRPSPNYFSVDPAGVENAWVNEFFAPFQGLEKVREAHGNWAAAELATEVCTGINDRISETQINKDKKTSPLDLSEEAIADKSPPFDANADSPYFAHLAMCKEGTTSKDPKARKLAPIQPPLGWMLSKWTQDKFPTLLSECGNDDELDQVEVALGLKPAPHHDGAEQAATRD
jgi:hypothetical protein